MKTEDYCEEIEAKYLQSYEELFNGNHVVDVNLNFTIMFDIYD